MKLRIKGDSLRLRVTRSELTHLLKGGGRIEETIHFTAVPQSKLTYALVIAVQTAPVSVEYGFPGLTVIVSEDQLQVLASENEIGIYALLDVGDSRSLEVSVEKDFACLDGSDEENSDTFTNPHAEANC